MKQEIVHAVVVIYVVLAGGCGRHDDAGDSRVEQPRVTHQPKQEAPHTSSTGTLARVVEKHLDASLKVMDDFSAALGAQYARFSYDTNRVLTAAHTNYLSRLSDHEFADFVADYSRAASLRGIQQDEFSFLYDLVLQRMAHLVSVGDIDTYNDVVFGTLPLAFQLNDSRAKHLAEQWLDYTWRTAHDRGTLLYLDNAMACVAPVSEYSMFPAGYLEHVLELFRRIADDSSLKAISPKAYLRTQLHAGNVECYADPQAALERFTSVRSDVHAYWRESTMEPQLCAFLDAKIEGLKQGLRGGALSEYARRVVTSGAAASGPLTPTTSP